MSKRIRVLTCGDAADPDARHKQITQVSDLLTLAHPATQLTQLVSVLLQHCPTSALTAVTQWSETKAWSSAAIRDAQWSRHLPWAMLDQIFLFLQVQELILAERICKRWRVASALRGLGWSRDITLIKSPILERQLKAPRKPVRCQLMDSAQHDYRLTVAFLTSFPELRDLELPYDCRWYNEHMKHLTTFPNLTRLEWTGHLHDGEGLEHIGNLKKLSTLILRRNTRDERIELTTFASAKLACLPLTHLELSGFIGSDVTFSPIFASCPIKTLTLRDGSLEFDSLAFTILSSSRVLTELSLQNTIPETLSSQSLSSLTLETPFFRFECNLDFAARFPRLTSLSVSQYDHMFGSNKQALYSLFKLPLKCLHWQDYIQPLSMDIFQLPRQLLTLKLEGLSPGQIRELSTFVNLMCSVSSLQVSCKRSLVLQDVQDLQEWPKLRSIRIDTPTQDFQYQDVDDAAKLCIYLI